MKTIVVAATLGVLLMTGSSLAAEGPRATPVFDTDRSLQDMLQTAQDQGKALVVVLEDGIQYTGKVKAVSARAVVLTELQGKEFFDAYVRLDAIVALEERVRLR